MKFFYAKRINEIAINVGFTKRVGKLEALTFVKAFVLGILNRSDITVKDIATICRDMQPGLQITSSAINQRLKMGVFLIKEVFKNSMECATKQAISVETVKILRQFSNVFICDASTLALPDKLAKSWKGLGGTNAKSALKIQVMFNILTKTYKKIDIVDATENDSKYMAEIVKQAKKNDLIIVDLGYFDTGKFKELEAKCAYFLSRVKSNATFYIDHVSKEGKFEKISILTLLKNSKNGVLDTYVYVGGTKTNRLLCRLVAVKLPEAIANERRRKANETARKKGETISKLQSEVLGYNMLITNTTEEMISTESICDVYRIRWQIELIFKSWKGINGIDKLGNINSDCLDCVIYGRLTMLVLTSNMFAMLYISMYKKLNKRISMLKFYKEIKNKNIKILDTIGLKSSQIDNLMFILESVATQSFHDKRSRKTTIETLAEYELPYDYTASMVIQ
ncbi:IS4 family transposase [Clostridium sp.]|uniref:IS4 family transposase n=1 Tax=Clostridium sp. TaxID=1506 RepID=UPI002601DBB0|nr:IS4 family transposase [Clostridium sp.]